MRIEQNQFVIQDRSQVSGGGTKPEAQSQATSASPANPQAFAGKQKQSLNQAESNQGGGNKATSLLSRLATLSGVNPIPVIPIKETQFFIDTQKNDSNNHHDRFVHISGDAIDTDGERDDLQNAMKQADKEGFPVIFIQGDENKPQYFEATSKDLNGQKPGYIAKVQSLGKGSTETFALENLQTKVAPLESLSASDLSALQALDSRQLAQVDAVGTQGPALLRVAQNKELLAIAQNLNPQQIKILASLDKDQLEAYRKIPAPSRAFIDIPAKVETPKTEAISKSDFDILNKIPPKTQEDMQKLSVKDLQALQALNGLPSEALAILDWEGAPFQALQHMNATQFQDLQMLPPAELQNLSALSTRMR